MGIFGKTNKQPKPETSTTVISNGTFIRGGIDTAGSVFCDGKFEGIMVVGDTVTIGKSGEIIGEIRAKRLIVSGMLDGLIDVEDAHILESGKVIGKMQYGNLEISKNGIFEGEGKMKNSNISSKYVELDQKKYSNAIEEEIVQED